MRHRLRFLLHVYKYRINLEENTNNEREDKNVLLLVQKLAELFKSSEDSALIFSDNYTNSSFSRAFF